MVAATMKTTLAEKPKPRIKLFCPECASGQVIFTRTSRIYWCRRCGFEWAKPKGK